MKNCAYVVAPFRLFLAALLSLTLPASLQAVNGPVRPPIKALVARITFPDLTEDPPVTDEGVLTVDFLRKRMQAASDRLKVESYGKDSIASTIIPKVLRLSKNGKDGSPNRINLVQKYNEIVAQARGLNLNMDDFDVLVIFHSDDLGGASVGGSLSEIKKKNGDDAIYADLNGTTSTSTVLHELGHTGFNLNGGHANYWKVNDGNPLSDNAVSVEYGDLTDLQGSSGDEVGQVSIATKLASDFVSTKNVPTVAASGRFTIFRFDHPDALDFNGADTLLGLKIPRDNNLPGGAQRSLYVSYRRSVADTPNPLLNNGAFIVWDDRLLSNFAVVDTQTPGTSAVDAALPVGKTLADAAKGIYITPVAQGGVAPAETLEVVVNIGTFPGNQAPTVAVTAPTSGLAAGNQLSFTAQASDPDNDELAYYWEVVGVPQPNRNSSTYLKTFARGGTYTVRCTVTDMKGQEASAETQVTISDPLMEWTQRESNVKQNLNSVAATGASIVGSGREPGRPVVRSGDAQVWTTGAVGGDLADPNGFLLNGVAAGNGILLGVGGKDGGKSYLATSPDGTTWTSRTTASANELRGAAFGNGLFVAVGDGGVIETSPDGATWTTRSSGVTKDLRSVAYGAAGFIIAGSGQTILQSTDGITWADRSYPRFRGDDSNFQVNEASVAYGAGPDLYVIASGGRIVITSPDGKKWMKRSLPGLFETYHVSYGNGVFLTASKKIKDNGTSIVGLVSQNGLEWSEFTYPGGDVIRATTPFGSTFVAVGDNGAIYQSGTISTPVLARPVVTSTTSAGAGVGASFNYAIVATGNPNSFGATGLPAGLALNADTGVISGRPASAGVAMVTLKATNAAGESDPVTLTLTVAKAKPTITSASTATGDTGVAFNFQVTATDADTVTATGLPDGLTYDGGTRAITGTPTADGTFTVALEATNTGGTTSAKLKITIKGPANAPDITSKDTVQVRVNTPFTYQITATNNPTTFAVENLPGFLNFNAATGTITGTFPNTGTFRFAVGASNALGGPIVDVDVEVVPAGADAALGGGAGAPPALAPLRVRNSSFQQTTIIPLATVSHDLTGWVLGGDVEPFAQSAVVFDGPYALQTGDIGDGQKSYVENTVIGPGRIAFRWKVSSELNADFLDVNVDGETFASLSGEEDWQEGEVEIPSGSHTIRFQYSKNATDSAGSDAGWLENVQYYQDSGPEVTSALTAAGDLGQPFTYQLTANDPTASFTVEDLPEGLTFNAQTSTISGTPTEPGYFNVQVSAVSDLGESDPVALELFIRGPAPVITGNLNIEAEVEERIFMYQITASNNPFAYRSSELPFGLFLDEGSGLIYGFPSGAGVFQIHLEAENVSGTGTAILNLTIHPHEVDVVSGNGFQAFSGDDVSYEIELHGHKQANFTSTDLPPGLTINATTGLITGQATAAGSYTATVHIVTEDSEADVPISILIGAPNDAFADRIELAGSKFGDTSENQDGTTETGEPDHAGAADSHSLWWTWTAPKTGKATISTAGSSFDTVLAVYTGDDVAALTPVAQNDDSANDGTSSVTFNVTAGTVYQIVVGGKNGATGEIVMAGRVIGAITYNGLVQSSLTPAHNGLATISVTDKRTFTLKLRTAATTYSLRAAFDALDGTFSGSIVRRNAAPLLVDLAIDLEHGTDAITGTITDGLDEATLWADAPQVNARRTVSPQAGKYTMAIITGQGSADQSAALTPQGNGIGTVTVLSNGLIRFAGTLGDGTKVSQGAILSGDGAWPFFATPYAPRGTVSGWLFFKTAAQPLDLTGSISWNKPAGSRRGLYLGGFYVDSMPVLGSKFTSAGRNGPALPFTAGNLTIAGGDAAVAVNPKPFTLGARNRITIAGAALAASGTAGTFGGNFTDDSGKKRVFAGVYLPSEGIGYGYYIGATATGAVQIAPAGP